MPRRKNSLPLDLRLEHLREVAAERQALYLERSQVKLEDGSTVWRWEHFGVQLRIVGAANRYGDFIVHGVRHFCVSMNAMIDLIGIDALHAYAGGPDNEEQGFVDQYGTFHNRRAAATIAIAAKQVNHEDLRGAILFSEDVW